MIHIDGPQVAFDYGQTSAALRPTPIPGDETGRLHTQPRATAVMHPMWVNPLARAWEGCASRVLLPPPGWHLHRDAQPYDPEALAGVAGSGGLDGRHVREILASNEYSHPVRADRD